MTSDCLIYILSRPPVINATRLDITGTESLTEAFLTKGVFRKLKSIVKYICKIYDKEVF